MRCLLIVLVGDPKTPVKFSTHAPDLCHMPDSDRLFPTTSQTLLEMLQSKDHKVREVSVTYFCNLYYPSVYGFARRLGLTVVDAQDRTQDFFMEVIADGLLTKFDPSRGTRFSTWLMACFRNQEINHHAARTRLKRGGNRIFVEFDPEQVEQSYQSLESLALGPAFDLMLARQIWRQSVQDLKNRHAGTPAEMLVAELAPFLLSGRWPGPPAPTQEAVALKHQTTTTRLKAFFNRTLKTQAKKKFFDRAAGSHPGITEAEITELWTLLAQYGED